MTPVAAILSEVILALVGLTSILLALVYRRCKSILHSDPDTVAATCSLIADALDSSNKLTEPQAKLDKCSNRELIDLMNTTTCSWRDDLKGKKVGFISSDGMREDLFEHYRNR